MPQLPTPVRAAVGLVATAMDEARRLPERAVELPMLAVSTALQVSLRAQQRYAHLAARGDELLNHHEITDDAPPWATFDDPVTGQPAAERRGSADRRDTADRRSTDDRRSTNDRRSTANRRSAANRRGTAGRRDADGDASGDGGAPDDGGQAPSKPARKTVRGPRNGKPSAFDAIGDE